MSEYKKVVGLLERVVERWNELENRDCSRHDFSCLVTDIENELESPRLPASDEPAPIEGEKCETCGCGCGVHLVNCIHFKCHDCGHKGASDSHYGGCPNREPAQVESGDGPRLVITDEDYAAADKWVSIVTAQGMDFREAYRLTKAAFIATRRQLMESQAAVTGE